MASEKKKDEQKLFEMLNPQVQYLKKHEPIEMQKEAAKYGLVPMFTQDGIIMRRLQRNFEQDCESLMSSDYFKSLTCHTIDVTTWSDDIICNKIGKSNSLNVETTMQSNKKLLHISGRKENTTKFCQYLFADRPESEIQSLESEYLTQGQATKSFNTDTSLESDLNKTCDYLTAPDQERHCDSRSHDVGSDKVATLAKTSEPQKDQESQYEEIDTENIGKTNYEHFRHKGSCIKISCTLGDLTKLNVDCIVNSTNDDFGLDAGVSYAIAKAAGDELVEECDKYYKKCGVLDYANVCITSAGKLPCIVVFHINATKYGETKSQTKYYLQGAFLECLHTAEKMQIKSIAFPAMGAGQGALTTETVSEAATDAICSFCESDVSQKARIEHIHFIDISPKAINDLQAAFASHSEIFEREE